MSKMTQVDILVEEFVNEHSRPYHYEIVERFYVGNILHCVINEFSPHGELDVTYTLTIDEHEKVTLLEK